MVAKTKLDTLHAEFARIMNELGTPLTRNHTRGEGHFGVTSVFSITSHERSSRGDVNGWNLTVLVVDKVIDKIILSHDPSEASVVLANDLALPSAIQYIKKAAAKA
ncbi:hypothetical protein MYOV003v1_p0055 [Vibrio phage 207E48.1]|nr:hypothetical protein MYOV003v1_p0055 [Vibrio phage 207E48.1]